jgi:glutamate 5-kinase
MTARPPLAVAHRLLVKVGTRVLAGGDSGVDGGRLLALVSQIAEIRSAGREVLLVSSGAVGLGRAALGLDRAPTRLALRQACAAVGQTQLMGLYQQAFAAHGLTTAQVLLTESDLDDRSRYLNLRSTLLTLLAQGVVPVLNENDVVSTAELAFTEGEKRPVFGDNDRLSALVATKLGADLLILLTDVAGLHAADPNEDPGAALHSRIDPEDFSAAEGLAGAPVSDLGRGGMSSKVDAALIAARSGCHAVIGSGLQPDSLIRIAAGDDVGTWFPAAGNLSARDRWLAFATAPRGTLHLDSGAVTALLDRGASLLAVGVSSVEGSFDRGDVVTLRAPDGSPIGRGIVHCDAKAARSWAAGEQPGGIRNHDALVHRDHLVLEPHLGSQS